MKVAASQLEDYRLALNGHCYRMLGSFSDAEDAVQETMIRAWKGLDRFEARASLKNWLYKIATNVCLDALNSRSKRCRPIEEGPVGTIDDELTTKPKSHWLEPVPNARVIPADADPSEAAVLKQSIRLAFMAAVQTLPPKQRAVLLLSEVLGWSAAEVASGLDMTTASVNSALQRARSTFAEREVVRQVQPLSSEQERLVDRYVDAFERYDVEALAALMRADATLSMPPFDLWLRGLESIRAWLLGKGIGCRGSKLVPVEASGSPAFAQYRDGGLTPWALIVLELEGDRVVGLNSFLDTETLFPLFGLPARLTH
jgi:RNA polymerase sigma-70 factor (ECF subfamily)